MEFGKFKDATSLLEGYNNLEKEFTKKCQAVAELRQKLLENQNSTKSDAVSEAAVGGCGTNAAESEENAASEVENLSTTLTPVQGANVVSEATEGGETNNAGAAEVYTLAAGSENAVGDSGELVKFSSAEWRRKVNSFFKENSDMADSRADIARVLLTNSDIRNSDDCLENAAKIVRESKPALINQKQNDLAAASASTFGGGGDKVDVGSEKNENEISAAEKPLSEYFSDLLKRKKASPSFVLGESKTFLASTNKEIKSLSDAKSYLLKNYFN